MKNCLIKSLKEAAWAPLIVVAFYAVAAKIFNAYIRWPGLDMPTHFCGGLAITYFFTVAIKHSQAAIGPIQKGVRLLLAIGLTTTAAVFWEFLEFLSDAWLGTKMNLGVTDTLSDLFFGILGAMIMALALGIFGKKPSPRSSS